MNGAQDTGTTLLPRPGLFSVLSSQQDSISLSLRAPYVLSCLNFEPCAHVRLTGMV